VKESERSKKKNGGVARCSVLHKREAREKSIRKRRQRKSGVQIKTKGRTFIRGMTRETTVAWPACHRAKRSRGGKKGPQNARKREGRELGRM